MTRIPLVLAAALVAAPVMQLPMAAQTAANAPKAAAPRSVAAARVETDQPIGRLETVAIFNGPMPTGVTVSQAGRIFVNFPRWGDDVPFTVAELVNGKAVAFPNAEINNWPGRLLPNPNAFADEQANQTHFVSVQSVVVDPADRLWVLDTGAPLLKNIVPGGPKLVCIDLVTNQVIRTILLPPETAGTNSYMNDVRFDLSVGENGLQDAGTVPGSRAAATPGKAPADPKFPLAERSAGSTNFISAGSAPTEAEARAQLNSAKQRADIRGTAYITDSASLGPNAIIVVDLATGKSFRRLNQHVSVLAEPGFLMFAEGRPVYQTFPGHPPEPNVFAADSIAISADGRQLYYCPINGTKLYAVSTSLLRDRSKSDAQVEGDVRIVTGKMPSDGLESDTAGNVYLSDPVTDSIHRWNSHTGITDTIAHDPRILWPDTMSLAGDGYLYFTANQLHRQPTLHNGEDLRQKPYSLFRIKVDGKPIRLR